MKTYNEFLDYVENVGVLSFGKSIEGVPTLGTLTEESQWHTADMDTDPWRWKDRAAAERKLAFGCVFGGQKGFIARRYYPLFYKAYHPDATIERSYSDGQISPIILNVYRLFEKGEHLSTSDIRVGDSKADAAIVALQRDFHITVSGNKRKISKKGEEYGWPANTYCLVTEWLGDWLAIDANQQVSRDEAREQIIDIFAIQAPSTDKKIIKKYLKF